MTTSLRCARSWVRGLVLLALSSSSVACSGAVDPGETGGTASGGDGAGGSATGGDASGGAATGGSGGGASGGAASGGGGGTIGCPVVPIEKLVPIVGPFYSGDHPGPCSQDGDLDGGNGVFSYDENELFAGVAGESITRDEQGRVIASSLFSQTYSYPADDEIVSGMTHYFLDERGYVERIEIDGSTTDTIMTFVYEDCRLIRRDDVDTNGTSLGYNEYAYDEAGNMISRNEVRPNQADNLATWDYSCW